MQNQPFIQKRNLAILLSAFFLASLLFIGFVRPMGFQWDFFVFYDAARSWQLKVNPYELSELAKQGVQTVATCKFTYLPLTIPIFLPFTFLSPAIAAGVWMMVKISFFALFLWASREVYRFKYNRVEDVLLLLMGFNATLMWDFTSGNISIVLYALLWLGIYFLKRNRTVLAGVLIALSAFVKIQPIAVLALALVYGDRSKWKTIVVGFLSLALFWAANYYFSPGSFQEFLAAAFHRIDAEHGILSPSALALAQDLLGQVQKISILTGVSGYLSGLTTFLYLVIVVAISVPSLWVLWLNKSKKIFNENEILSLFLLTYILVIPRVKSYDFILLLPVAAFLLARRKEKSFLYFLLLTPVIFQTNGVLEFISYPHLGFVTKLFYLLFQYLPYWGVLALWVGLVQDFRKTVETQR